jgi:hypothetical protein
MRHGLARYVVMFALAAMPGALASQVSTAPPPPAITAVLATLTLVPSADRTQMTRTMPDEVRATVKLYLDGKIQQWYARADGHGVVFVMNCGSAAEAKALTDSLPLVKGKLASFEFVELTPLAPLRYLLPTAAPGPANPQAFRRLRAASVRLRVREAPRTGNDATLRQSPPRRWY